MGRGLESSAGVLACIRGKFIAEARRTRRAFGGKLDVGALNDIETVPVLTGGQVEKPAHSGELNTV
jgi:hypothetical protein